jgi:hypothetical protein
MLDIFFGFAPLLRQKSNDSSLKSTCIQEWFFIHAWCIWKRLSNFSMFACVKYRVYWQNSYWKLKFRLLAVYHATLALVWLSNESWENSLKLASQLSCNFCSRLNKQWKLRKLSCKLSLLNSHATHVLVWSSHESTENSHVNSRLLADPTSKSDRFYFEKFIGKFVWIGWANV